MNLNGDNLVSVGASLYTNNRLVKLDLSHNQLGSKLDRSKSVLSVKFLAQESCCLQELVLANNSLDFTFGIALAEALKLNKSLTVLNVSKNSLSAKNGLLLGFSEMLKTNTVLKSLDVSLNNIQNSGIADLIQGLAQNSTLEALVLDGSTYGFGSQIEMAMTDYFDKVQLKVLSMNNMNISDKELAQVFFSCD